MPKRKSPTLPLPRVWKHQLKSAVLQVISLANYAITQARGRALHGNNGKTRSAVETAQILDYQRGRSC